MGRRSVLPSYEVLPASDGSQPQETLVSEVQGVDVIGYDVLLTGNLNGDVKVYYSNEENIADATWLELDFGQSITLDAVADTDNRFEIKTSFKRTKLAWTPNTGTGNLTVKVFGLVRGA